MVDVVLLHLGLYFSCCEPSHGSGVDVDDPLSTRS